MNNNIIDEIYNDNNYPGLEKLYKLVKSDHPKITKNEVKDFLDNQLGEQLLKTTKKKSRKKLGTITATYENELWQLDIFDLSKFAKFNSNYLYILCAIDVFTRKAYCQAMKNKDAPDCIKAFENMISSGDVPHSLFSDNDASFLSNSFSSMLDRKRIAFNVNTINDHHSLGIIDSFAKRLKLIIAKTMIKNKDKNWINHLQAITTKYNNMKLPVLKDVKPNQVTEPKNNQIVYDLNVAKSKKMNMKSDLVINDHVRLKITTKFTKSSDIQFSDHVYKVNAIDGGNITLDNGQTVKRSQLLKVTGLNTMQTAPNVISQVNKSSKVDRVLKSDGVDRSNVVKTKKQVSNILKVGGIDQTNILTTSRRRK
jgi:hypothetical protein